MFQRIPSCFTAGAAPRLQARSEAPRTARGNAPLLVALLLLTPIGVCAKLQPDSLLKGYSLFGQEWLKIEAWAKTAKGNDRGGHVGSNRLVDAKLPSDAGVITVRNRVLTDTLRLGNANNGSTFEGDVLAERIDLEGDIRFDKARTFVRQSLNYTYNNNTFRRLLLGTSQFTKRDWASATFGGTAWAPFTPTVTTATPGKPDSISFNAPLPPLNAIAELPDTAVGAPGSGTYTHPFPMTVAVGQTGAAGWGTATSNPLVAGTYKSLTIQSGGTMILGEGTYVFDDITIQSDGARLLAWQPTGRRTTIIVRGTLRIENGSAGRVNAIEPVTQTNGQMLVVVQNPGTTELGTFTRMRATISAPRGQLTLKDGFALFGQAFAKYLYLDTQFDGDDGLFVPIDLERPTIDVGTFHATVREGSGPSPANDSLLTFQVTLSHTNGLGVRVWYRTFVDASHSATPAVDYRDTMGQLYFPAGDTLAFVRVRILPDWLWEGDETLGLELFAPESAVLDSVQRIGRGTILDDETPPNVRMSIDRQSIVESGGQALVRIRLSAPQPVPVRVRLDRRGGTAIPGTDFAWTGFIPVDFPVGDTIAEVPVAILDDPIDEDGETIDLVLRSPVGVALHPTDTLHMVTIEDDDPPPLVGFRLAAGSGLETIGTDSLEIVLSAPSSRQITLGYSVGHGSTANMFTDFDFPAGTLTFPAGTTSRKLALRVIDDNIDENPETAVLALYSPTNASLGQATHTYTILDDDPPPSVNFLLARNSGGEGADRDSVVIVLSAASGHTVIVRFRLDSGGTASPFADYQPINGTIPFAPGLKRTKFPLWIFQDLLDENDETIHFSIYSVDSGFIGSQNTHIYTILDDDQPPSVGFRLPASAGTESVGTDSIEVALSAPSGLPITVAYGLGTGSSATAGADFATPAGTLTFPARTTVRKLPLSILQDLLDENDETVALALSAPTNASLGAQAGHTYTILDDDQPPSVGFRLPASAGTESVGTDSIDVALSAPSGLPITVAYGLGTGSSATAGADFATPAGTLAFPAGTTVRKLPLSILQDLLDENDETVELLLSAPTNASLGAQAGHTYTILDDDQPPSVGFRLPASAGTESVGTDSIEVALSAPSGLPITVAYGLGTGSSATAGADFATPAGTLTFPAGTTVRKLPLSILQDLLDENDETVELLLSAPTNASLGAQAGHTYAILDDDALPALSVDSLSVIEPTAGLRPDSVTIRLSAVSGRAVDLVWQTSDGSAFADLDYEAAGPATVRIPAGTTTVRVPVAILGDALDEPDEYLVVRLVGSANATIARDSARLWILDSDDAPSVSIDSITVVEPASGKTSALFTIRLSTPSGKRVSVRWSTSDGTAQAGLDYEAAADSAVLLPGQVQTTARVQVLPDDISGEGVETFRVALADPLDATLGATPGLGHIRDGDGLPRLTIAGPPPVEENDTLVTFALRLSNPSAVPITVRWNTLEGTATRDRDFSDTSGTVLFPAGTLDAQIGVRILEDRVREPVAEWFLASLAGDTNVAIAEPFDTAVIVDDWDMPAVLVDDAAPVVEGGSAVFRLRLAARSADTIRVIWRTEDGTATAAEDFTGQVGDTVLFLPGQTSSQISVATSVDSLWEPTESFSIRLLDAPGGTVIDSLALGSILEEGPAPTIAWTVADTTVPEAVGTVRLTAVLSRPAGIALSFPVTARGITAAIPADASLETGRLDFAPRSRIAATALRVVDDSTDEHDETLELSIAPAGPVSVVSGGPARVTILDDDLPPFFGFDADTLRRPESAGRITLPMRPSRPSGKEIVAWISVSGSATPGADHDLPGDRRIRVVLPAGDTVAHVAIGILDDRIDESDESMVLTIDSLVDGRAGNPGTLLILDDDGAPRASFAKPDTTVPESAGRIRLQVVLDRPAAWPTAVAVRPAGTVTLSGSQRDVLVDSLVRVAFAAGDTVAWIEFDIVGDGRVEPTEVLQLGFEALPGGGLVPGRGIDVRITDDDRAPDVRIERPLDGLRTNVPGQVVEWTWDGRPQAPADTILREGWNTIGRCAVDTAGNVGCDTVRVWGDFTPPAIEITQPATPLLTNHSDVVVLWRVDDDGRISNLRLDTTLAEGVHRIVRTACDELGNCASDTAEIEVDLTPPKVVILTPPNGSTVPGGRTLVEWLSIDRGDTTRHREIVDLPLVGPTTLERCAQDAAGNQACDASTLVVQAPMPSKSWFVDTDGDGRIDAAIVEFPAPMSGKPPVFGFDLDTADRRALEGARPWAGPSRGTVLRDSLGRAVRDARGDTIRVVAGLPVLDSLDRPVRDAEGRPVVVPAGDTLRAPDGRLYRDAEGRELFRVPGNGQPDSARLIVPIAPPFAFGVTSVDSDTAGLMILTIRTLGAKGDTVTERIARRFSVGDSVPPVVGRAVVHRTEDYESLDTLFITPSEPLVLARGGEWIEIKKGGEWVKVPAESVFVADDGRLWILLPPGEKGSPAPGLPVRFRSGVSDSMGNTADPVRATWSTVVEGPPRPPHLVMRPPEGLSQVPRSEFDVRRPAGFTLTATSGDARDSFEPWLPGTGYGAAAEARQRAVCTDLAVCTGVELEVNAPMKVVVYVYDGIGVHVGGFEFELTARDLAKMRPDKLERYRVRILWNQRDQEGRIVATGVYPWRVVAWHKVPGSGQPILENRLVKVGVRTPD